jgi:phenylpropionate dioxygenase-like ring-hydroxylating dioxygenase large terminal subunit
MPYLRNTWYVAMWGEHLAASALAARKILDQPIVLYRTSDGAPAALLDRCPHRFAPLHRGQRVGDDRIRCGYHGLEFDAKGVCVRNPHGDGKLPPASVRAFPVTEKHSIVWIWMGDPALADPALIPSFPMLDENSGFQLTKRDGIRMEAYYQLITDNLLDLSHVSFLHDGILGNADTIPADIKVEQNGTQVVVTRAMKNVRVPGMFDLLFRRDGGRVDMWTDMRWDAPGCMLNDAGVTTLGGPRSAGTGIFGTHFLTPETERTTLYHFCAARQNPLPFPAEVADDIRRQLTDLRRMAFEEQDEPMIRAQQQALEAADFALKPVLLAIDAGPARYKRVLERLIAQERQGAERAA